MTPEFKTRPFYRVYYMKEELKMNENAWILTLDDDYKEPTMVRNAEPDRNEFFVMNRTIKDLFV